MLPVTEAMRNEGALWRKGATKRVTPNLGS